MFLALALLLALGLRLWGLDRQSLWFDEGWSVHLAQIPLSQALAEIASEGHTHPPGYYVLLWLWVRLWGDGITAVRGLSVLLGVAGVAALYLAGLTLYDRSTGVVASFLLAIAPAHIVYSQETRMYALLVLCSALLLALYARWIDAPNRWPWHFWLALIATEIVAAYTHFSALVVLLSLAAWLVATMLRGGRRTLPLLWRWIASQMVVALALLPWLGTALARATSHAPLDTSTPGPASFFAQVWVFLMGGHIALYGREPLFAVLALACLAVTALAGIALWRWRAERGRIIFLCVQALLPQSVIYLLMRARPGFHPRYALMMLLPFALLVARALSLVATRTLAAKATGVLLGLLWLVTAAYGAHALATDRYYWRDDARGAVAYLRAAEPDALLLTDVDDWALRYYLGQGDGASGRTLLFVDGRPPEEVVAGELRGALEGQSRVARITWHQGETDRRGLLPFLLERQGVLIETRHLAGYTVYHYALDHAPPELRDCTAQVDIGPFRLMAASVERGAPADEGLTCAMRWRLQAPVATEYKVSLVVEDSEGRGMAVLDDFLRNRLGRGTSEWTPGEEVTTYHVLPLGPGLAPLAYRLQLAVYEEAAPVGLDVLDEGGAPAGKRYTLCTVSLAPKRGLAQRSVDRSRFGLSPLRAPAKLADGLELQAWALGQNTVDAGNRLQVLLEWRSTSGQLPDYHPILRLVRSGQIVTAQEVTPVNGAYPTSFWRKDEVVLDWQYVTIPHDDVGGTAELQVAVDPSAPVVLGQVQVRAVERAWSAPPRQVEMQVSFPPVAQFVGYDTVGAELTSGRPFTFTLYWRSLSFPSQDYAVFVHLLGQDGRVVAQHDGPPREGNRPTSGWVKDEFIMDQHTVQWNDPQYRGPATMEIGLYDPLSGQRLKTTEGDSRLLLPGAIMLR